MSVAARGAGPPPRCSVCDGELHAVGGPGEVTHDTVAGVAVGPVAWACPRRAEDAAHDRLAPTLDEAATSVRESLDVARRTAIRGTLRCGVCDTPFALPGRRTSRTVTITGGAPAVTLTFDVPVLRCTEDAVDNVPPEALEDALTVVATLLGGDEQAPRDGGSR